MKIIENLGCFLEELGGCLIYELCKAGVFRHYIRLWGMGLEGLGAVGFQLLGQSKVGACRRFARI